MAPLARIVVLMVGLAPLGACARGPAQPSPLPAPATPPTATSHEAAPGWIGPTVQYDVDSAGPHLLQLPGGPLAPPGSQGLLSVTSAVSPAAVTIDHGPTQTVPFEQPVAVGEHQISGFCPNGRGETHRVVVEAGTSVHVRICQPDAP
jgi:hypothetical protein